LFCGPDTRSPVAEPVAPGGLKFSLEARIVAAMKKGDCKGNHSGHLCVLASNEQIDKIKELTRKPQYICFNCGRVADCDDNLCNPMSLED
jgi:hypothetical protein